MSELIYFNHSRLLVLWRGSGGSHVVCWSQQWRKGHVWLALLFWGESLLRVNSSQQAEYVTGWQTSINGKCTSLCLLCSVKVSQVMVLEALFLPIPRVIYIIRINDSRPDSPSHPNLKYMTVSSDLMLPYKKPCACLSKLTRPSCELHWHTSYHSLQKHIHKKQSLFLLLQACILKHEQTYSSPYMLLIVHLVAV